MLLDDEITELPSVSRAAHPAIRVWLLMGYFYNVILSASVRRGKAFIASWRQSMTTQRIELLDEARTLVAKAMNHRCTTQDEFHDLYQIIHKIDHAKSDWEWLEYEGKQ